jgi:hypothetical protein
MFLAVHFDGDHAAARGGFDADGGDLFLEALLHLLRLLHHGLEVASTGEFHAVLLLFQIADAHDAGAGEYFLKSSHGRVGEGALEGFLVIGGLWGGRGFGGFAVAGAGGQFDTRGAAENLGEGLLDLFVAEGEELVTGGNELDAGGGLDDFGVIDGIEGEGGSAERFEGGVEALFEGP